MQITISAVRSYSQPVCEKCGGYHFASKPLRIADLGIMPRAIFCTSCGRIAAVMDQGELRTARRNQGYVRS